MSDKKEHTPTPWRKHRQENDAIVCEKGKAIAHVYTPRGQRSEKENAANLEFIVEACNSHSRLVQENEELKKERSLLIDQIGKITPEMALHWYKKGIVDRDPTGKGDGMFEDGIDADFHEQYSHLFRA